MHCDEELCARADMRINKWLVEMINLELRSTQDGSLQLGVVLASFIFRCIYKRYQ